jgi:hypothetical protein
MAVVEHHQTPLANYDRVSRSAPDRPPYFHSFSLFIRTVTRESIAFDTVFQPEDFVHLLTKLSLGDVPAQAILQGVAQPGPKPLA